MDHYGITIEDLKPISPFSQGSTEIFLTGHWSSRKPVYVKKISPCREACPAGNDISGVLALIAEGQFDLALELILQENPFPGICGRVCYHPCQTKCNRDQFDEAVEIRALERSLADYGSASPKVSSAEPGTTIAVVGSGPAGLAAAYFLACFGHKVTIYERNQEPGGVLRYGIPDYRLPKDVVKKEIDRVLALGIDLKTGINVDRKILTDLRSGYDFLFLSVGAWSPRTLGMRGEDANNILYGLDFLSRQAKNGVCRGKKHIVVIGGGDVAVDVARTAARYSGAGTRITMVAPEKLGEFPAIPEGIVEAKDEGIKMIGGYRPSEFAGNGVLKQVHFVRTKVHKDPTTGIYKMLPADGKGLSLEADLVIIAIGQAPELDPFTAEILEDDGSKVYINEFGMTPLAGVYAGGDLVKQRPAVVDAIASGKRAAIAIDADAREIDPAKIFSSFRLGSGSSLSAQVYQGASKINVQQVVQFSELNTLPYRKSPPLIGQKVSPKSRTQDFGEVNMGLDRTSAIEEAKRCFYCGTCTGCDLCFLLCPDLSIVKTGFKDYDVSADYCKGCGQCATTCPRHVIDMREAPGGGK
jgi:NADPH-dependent glutamate synthase beta subunit-like oxidoreductase